MKIKNKIIATLSTLAIAFVTIGTAISVRPVAEAKAVGNYNVDPVAFYSGINPSLKGNALMGALHDLLATEHKTFTSYDDCKNPTYIYNTDMYSSSDKNNVMDFYTQQPISKSWGSGKAGTWNREHVWCQALTSGGGKQLWGTSGGGGDIHHIRPTETRLNGDRSNHAYGEVPDINSATKCYSHDLGDHPDTSKLGGYLSGDTFEPLDNVKGDVARIIFYLYVHYNTYSNVHGTTNGSGNGSFYGTLLITKIMSPNNEKDCWDMLLRWNNNDKVSDLELNRNDWAARYTGIRNPFIDNESYANAIWGNGTVNPPTPPTPSDPVALQGVSLNKQTLSLTEGKTEKLVPTFKPSNATNKNITWSTTNASVASVNQEGLVTANSVGTTNIKVTAEDGGFNATCKVTVSEKAPTSAGSFTITIDSFSALSAYDSDDSWSVTTGNGETIEGIADVFNNSQTMQTKNAKTPFSNTTPLPGNLSSVDIAVNSGTSKARTLTLYGSKSSAISGTSGTKIGTASLGPNENGTITVSNPDQAEYRYFALSVSGGAIFIDSITINYTSNTTVTKPTSISLSTNNVTLDVNEEVSVTASVLPANAPQALTWTANPTGIVSISNNVITGLAKGQTVITVSAKDYPNVKNTINVTVNEVVITPTSITVNPTSLDLFVNDTATLTATVNPSGANQSVTWSVSPSGIVSVSDGFVTALSEGNATIKVTSTADLSVFKNIPVTVNASSGGVVTPTGETLVDTKITTADELTTGKYLLTGQINNSTVIFDPAGNTTTGKTIKANDFKTNRDAYKDYFVTINVKITAQSKTATIYLEGAGSDANHTKQYLAAPSSSKLAYENSVDSAGVFTISKSTMIFGVANDKGCHFVNDRSLLLRDSGEVRYYSSSNNANQEYGALQLYRVDSGINFLKESLSKMTCNDMHDAKFIERINYFYNKLSTEDKELMNSTQIKVSDGTTQTMKYAYDRANYVYTRPTSKGISMMEFDDVTLFLGSATLLSAFVVIMAVLIYQKKHKVE